MVDELVEEGVVVQLRDLLGLFSIFEGEGPLFFRDFVPCVVWVPGVAHYDELRACSVCNLLANLGLIPQFACSLTVAASVSIVGPPLYGVGAERAELRVAILLQFQFVTFVINLNSRRIGEDVLIPAGFPRTSINTQALLGLGRCLLNALFGGVPNQLRLCAGCKPVDSRRCWSLVWALLQQACLDVVAYRAQLAVGNAFQAVVLAQIGVLADVGQHGVAVRIPVRRLTVLLGECYALVDAEVALVVEAVFPRNLGDGLVLRARLRRCLVGVFGVLGGELGLSLRGA